MSSAIDYRQAPTKSFEVSPEGIAEFNAELAKRDVGHIAACAAELMAKHPVQGLSIEGYHAIVVAKLGNHWQKLPLY